MVGYTFLWHLFCLSIYLSPAAHSKLFLFLICSCIIHTWKPFNSTLYQQINFIDCSVVLFNGSSVFRNSFISNLGFCTCLIYSFTEVSKQLSWGIKSTLRLWNILRVLCWPNMIHSQALLFELFLLHPPSFQFHITIRLRPEFSIIYGVCLRSEHLR